MSARKTPPPLPPGSSAKSTLLMKVLLGEGERPGEALGFRSESVAAARRPLAVKPRSVKQGNMGFRRPGADEGLNPGV